MNNYPTDRLCPLFLAAFIEDARKNERLDAAIVESIMSMVTTHEFDLHNASFSCSSSFGIVSPVFLVSLSLLFSLSLFSYPMSVPHCLITLIYFSAHTDPPAMVNCNFALLRRGRFLTSLPLSRLLFLLYSYKFRFNLYNIPPT